MRYSVLRYWCSWCSLRVFSFHFLQLDLVYLMLALAIMVLSDWDYTRVDQATALSTVAIFLSGLKVHARNNLHVCSWSQSLCLIAIFLPGYNCLSRHNHHALWWNAVIIDLNSENWHSLIQLKSPFVRSSKSMYRKMAPNQALVASLA